MSAARGGRPGAADAVDTEGAARTGGALAELLAGRPVTHVRWGLDRIEALLEAVGRPERSFRALHFAGTNGKGSAAATAAAVLGRAGRRVGLYTSPHLLDVRERIRVDGAAPADALLDACAERVAPVAGRVGATYFEALTAVGFLAFAEAGVEWAAVETGLGGRLDATRALHPAVCVITSIARDHTEYLGDALEAIAAEKAGILEPGAPAVLGPIPPRPRRVLEARAREVGAPLARVGREARVDRVRVALEGTGFRYRSARWPDGLLLHTPLVGRHQAANAAVAVLALERLSAAGEGWAEPGAQIRRARGDRPDRTAAREEARAAGRGEAETAAREETAIREGVAGVRIAGRFQRLEGAEGTWVLDIAHNPAAFRALRSTVGRLPLPRPLAWLVGILADKEWERMLGPLVAAGDRAVLTVAPAAPPARRWEPRAAAEAADPGGRALEAVPEFDAAMRRARELAGRGTVVVAGSAYTVGEALRRLGGEAVGDPGRGPPLAAGDGAGRPERPDRESDPTRLNDGG